MTAHGNPRLRGARVALVAPSLKMGGLELMVRDLAIGLSRRGIPAAVFVTRSSGVYAEDLEQAGVPVWDCHAPRPRMTRVPIRLARHLARFGPRIIHGHSGTWLPCAVAKRVLRHTSLVFTDHGRYRPEPKSRAFFERHVYNRQTDRLVAVSSDLADYLQRFLRLASRPEVIPNGVDLGTFASCDPSRRAELRSAWGVEDGELLAISVGRLEPVKNHLGLLAALAEAAATVPTIRLAIAGTGRQRDTIVRRAEELGLQERTLFLGHRRDIPDCLRAADLFVSASTSEGLPVSLLEAMAAGLPVISTAVGGIPEALGSPPAGLLVSPGQTAPLAAAIVELARDPARRKALGAAAREQSRRYSLEACVDRYCDLYDGVLSPDTDGPRAWT